MKEAKQGRAINCFLPSLGVFLGLFLSWPAVATTFGPIRVANQVEHSDYIVHGRIVGAQWVLEEKSTRRPYTYWKLQVIDQPKGNPLGAEVDIRQPGGEIGSMGYHVAGSANFRPDEDVFVVLRDTDEQAKEVVALSSGKYTVSKGENGALQVESGLGTIMRDPNGHAYTPDEFSGLIRRLAAGKANESEKSVYVNKMQAHEHDPRLERMEAEARDIQAKSVTPPPASLPPAAPQVSSQTLVQESPPSAEETSSSSVGWWVLGGVGVIAALAGYFLLRKP